MKIRSISLPEGLDQAAAAAAQRDGRKYSDWARRAIERAVGEVTGETRLADLEEIAAAGLADYEAAHAPRARSNPAEIIAAASTAGHDALRAHQQIAAGNRKSHA
jgi:hypothetical protein